MTLGSFHHIPCASNLHRTPNTRGTWYLPLQCTLLIDIDQPDTSNMSYIYDRTLNCSQLSAIVPWNTSYTVSIRDRQCSSKPLISIVQLDTMWNTFHTYDLQ
jgi:hypothetical protein